MQGERSLTGRMGAAKGIYHSKVRWTWSNWKDRYHHGDLSKKSKMDLVVARPRRGRQATEDLLAKMCLGVGAHGRPSMS
jgi:hypothetical protein